MIYAHLFAKRGLCPEKKNHTQIKKKKKKKEKKKKEKNREKKSCKTMR